MSTRKCPNPKCKRRFRPSKTLKQRIQHHLYMAHNMEVMESHKLAELAARDEACGS